LDAGKDEEEMSIAVRSTLKGCRYDVLEEHIGAEV
jgi:hypothetical protein